MNHRSMRDRFQIIAPKKSRWETLRAHVRSWSPQVKQGIIAASVAALLAVGGWLFYQKNSTPSTNATNTFNASNNSGLIQNAAHDIVNYYGSTNPAPVVISLADAVREYEENRLKNDKTIASRVFWLRKEKGATFTLGPCPGTNCLNFVLGDFKKLSNGQLFQLIYASGGALMEKAVENGVPGFRTPGAVTITGGCYARQFPNGWLFGLPMDPNENVHARLPFADVTVSLIDCREDALRMKVEITPSTLDGDSLEAVAWRALRAIKTNSP